MCPLSCVFLRLCLFFWGEGEVFGYSCVLLCFGWFGAFRMREDPVCEPSVRAYAEEEREILIGLSKEPGTRVS